ncbi:MAG: hypothetical protein IKB97_00615 [Bacteroidaceae bacterium]|nr:hypothetical protein [Bacteroidaceae bacterium]
MFGGTVVSAEKKKHPTSVLAWYACVGVVFWMIFKNPIFMLAFLLLGMFVDKKNKQKDN